MLMVFNLPALVLVVVQHCHDYDILRVTAPYQGLWNLTLDRMISSYGESPKDPLPSINGDFCMKYFRSMGRHGACKDHPSTYCVLSSTASQPWGRRDLLGMECSLCLG